MKTLSYLMANKNDNLEHRGRFQAQGGGVEESECWAQEKPLSLSSALRLLAKLIGKLAFKDYEKRRNQFDKAEQFVKNAAESGGLYANTSKSFNVKGSKDERVDIEVWAGKAFVQDQEDDKT